MASKNEEIVNSTTHGIGVFLAIAATAILAVRAALYGDAWHVVAFCVFGAGLINLYIASTVFHGAKNIQRFRVYETFGISKRFPIKPLRCSLSVPPLKSVLSAKCFIYRVRGWCSFISVCLSVI